MTWRHLIIGVIANLFELDEMTWRHLTLEYWKVIANLFELDEMTSRSLLRTSRIGNIGSLEILMSVPHTTRRANMILVHVKRLKIADLLKFMFLEVLPTLGLNSILWDCFGVLEHRPHQVPR